MVSVPVGLLFLVCAFACLCSSQPSHSHQDQAQCNNCTVRESQWLSFKTRFSKLYPSLSEEAYRFQVFSKNMDRASELERNNPQATFGINIFSDLEHQEWKTRYAQGYSRKRRHYTGKPSSPIASDTHTNALPPIPPSQDIDWRTKGAVTLVKNQGKCGSCWAFSATQTVESAWFLRHGELRNLSVQQVVSCDTKDGGCEGGFVNWALQYIQEHGLESDEVYPYTSGPGYDSGVCKFEPSEVVAKITGFVSTPEGDESAVFNHLVNMGPAATCVNVDSWQLYTGGILTNQTACPSMVPEHCVQVVGYNTGSPGAGAGSTPYWIVKNQWGTDWGVQGYIYLQYGLDMCGVADEPYFVVSA